MEGRELPLRIFSTLASKIKSGEESKNKFAPSPWFMGLSLARFSFMHIFKTFSKDLVHVDFPLVYKENSSFMGKLITELLISLVLFWFVRISSRP